MTTNFGVYTINLNNGVVLILVEAVLRTFGVPGDPQTKGEYKLVFGFLKVSWPYEAHDIVNHRGNRVICFHSKGVTKNASKILNNCSVFVQLGPKSKQSLILKVWTKDEH